MSGPNHRKNLEIQESMQVKTMKRSWTMRGKILWAGLVGRGRVGKKMEAKTNMTRKIQPSKLYQIIARGSGLQMTYGIILGKDNPGVESRRAVRHRR